MEINGARARHNFICGLGKAVYHLQHRVRGRRINLTRGLASSVWLFGRCLHRPSLLGVSDAFGHPLLMLIPSFSAAFGIS